MWNRQSIAPDGKLQKSSAWRSGQEFSSHNNPDLEQEGTISGDDTGLESDELGGENGPDSDAEVVVVGESEANAARLDDVYGQEEDSWQDGPQLCSDLRVPTSMSAIALDQFPAERVHDERAPDGGRSALPYGDDFSQISDADIMLRAGAGDDACFEFLASKYRRPIISFMYRMVHNQAIAEELAQEVFLRVYRARSSYRAEARFTTWLYRIASNMAINQARDTKSERASRSVYLDQVDEDTGTTPDLPDLRPLVEQDLLHDERMRQIRDEVMALPDRQRAAVVMHKYHEMDYKQIGAVLKLSESATKSLLFRAYQALRERLKEYA
jgi:RNA polymerase sigma-70 factor (ECF subfamily)